MKNLVYVALILMVSSGALAQSKLLQVGASGVSGMLGHQCHCCCPEKPTPKPEPEPEDPCIKNPSLPACMLE